MVHLQTKHINPFLLIDFKHYMLSYDLDYNSNGEWTTVEESNIPSWDILKNPHDPIWVHVPPISEFRISFFTQFTKELNNFFLQYIFFMTVEFCTQYLLMEVYGNTLKMVLLNANILLIVMMIKPLI